MIISRETVHVRPFLDLHLHLSSDMTCTLKSTDLPVTLQ